MTNDHIKAKPAIIHALTTEPSNFPSQKPFLKEAIDPFRFAFKRLSLPNLYAMGSQRLFAGYLLVFGLFSSAFAEETSGTEYYPDGHKTHYDQATSYSSSGGSHTETKTPIESTPQHAEHSNPYSPTYSQQQAQQPQAAYYSIPTAYNEVPQAQAAPQGYHSGIPPAPAVYKPATSAYSQPALPTYHQPATSVYNQPAPPTYHQYQQPVQATSVYHQSQPQTYHSQPLPGYNVQPAYNAQPAQETYKPATSVYNPPPAPKIPKQTDYNPYGQQQAPQPQGYGWEKDFHKQHGFDMNKFTQGFDPGFGHDLNQKLAQHFDHASYVPKPRNGHELPQPLQYGQPALGAPHQASHGSPQPQRYNPSPSLGAGFQGLSAKKA
ncbi:hypothetical protein L596_009011 [Steinernema carpocapsae]|uniref:Uncharacterized protein n=1 Tax=Steinernema carpocapsae TaxID=34508 RepID=A0A4U5PEY3_STECR|nr:hypothetical protein L596_009011 [Steinernema carpocapsae]